jgi:hypothetical protein
MKRLKVVTKNVLSVITGDAICRILSQIPNLLLYEAIPLVTWYKNRASVDNLTGAAYNCSCFPF